MGGDGLGWPRRKGQHGHAALLLYPVLLVVPFAVMSLVAIADVMAGPTVGFLALFSLGPAFASVAGTARRAVVVGVMASRSVYGAGSGQREPGAMEDRKGWQLYLDAA